MDEREELAIWKEKIREEIAEEASRKECYLHQMFLSWLLENGIVTPDDFEQFLEDFALWNIAQEHGYLAEDEIIYGNS